MITMASSPLVITYQRQHNRRAKKGVEEAAPPPPKHVSPPPPPPPPASASASTLEVAVVAEAATDEGQLLPPPLVPVTDPLPTAVIDSIEKTRMASPILHCSPSEMVSDNSNSLKRKATYEEEEEEEEQEYEDEEVEREEEGEGNGFQEEEEGEGNGLREEGEGNGLREEGGEGYGLREEEGEGNGLREEEDGEGNGLREDEEDYEVANVRDLSRPDRRNLRKRLRRELFQVQGMIAVLEAKEFRLKEKQYCPSYFQKPSIRDYPENHNNHTTLHESPEVSVETPPPSPPPPPSLPVKEGWRVHRPSILIPDVGGNGFSGVVIKEKRTPKANQLYANSEYISGKEKLPTAEKVKTKSSLSSKRNSRVDPLMDSEYGKKLRSVMNQCGLLLRKLMTHRYGWVFNQPVDVKLLGLHDYYRIILRPMDLGTIKKNLESGNYCHPLDFAADVRLTFANAMRYNPEGNDVHVMADVLRKIFEERWRSLSHKLRELAEVKEGLMSSNNHSRPQPIPSFQREILKPHYQYSITKDVSPKPFTKKTELSDARTPVPVVPPPAPTPTPTLTPTPAPAPAPAAAPTPTPAPAPAPAPVEPKKSSSKKQKLSTFPDRPMNYREKRELSKKLECLTADKADQIIRIIKNKNPNVVQTDEEIEVDIEAFDNATLWDLYRIVIGCSKLKGKVKKPAEEETPNSSVKPIDRKLQPSNGAVHKMSEMTDVGREVKTPPAVSAPSKGPPVVTQSVDQHSSSSGSSSGSSSSDSDSGSSSESDSDEEEDGRTPYSGNHSPAKIIPDTNAEDCSNRLFLQHHISDANSKTGEGPNGIESWRRC